MSSAPRAGEPGPSPEPRSPRAAPASGPSDQALAGALDRIAREGFCILEDVISADHADALVADLERLERERGVRPSSNPFEGSRTVRIYNLLRFGPLYQEIPVHPAVLPVVEGVLDPGCLISSLSSIAIGPGESAQMIHSDDQLIPLPKPHVPIVCNTMWALTDFTEANGATRLVPGSHLRDHSPDVTKQYDSIAAGMRKGSVLVWNGSLWHGGGANRTDARRVGVAMNYCAGWVRQQENQQLGLPVETVRGFPARLRELVGYGVYNHLIGHIEKQSPAQVLLGDAPPLRTLWDRGAPRED